LFFYLLFGNSAGAVIRDSRRRNKYIGISG
jgi:hypothetical protein